MSHPWVPSGMRSDSTGPDRPAWSPSSLVSPVAVDATGQQTVENPLRDYDRTTGAPARVRVALSAAGSPEDQLATLKRFYPDAHRAPNGALAFTNPETGKKTLVNERWGAGKFLGFSAGDLAASAPVVGEVGGAVAGSVAGGPAGPVTRVAGGALGFAGGKKVGEIIAKIADRATNEQPAQDTRTFRDQAVETLLDIPQGAMFEMGGMLVPRVPGMVAGAVRGARQGGRVASNAMRVARETGDFGAALRAASRGEGALPETTIFGGVPDPVADAMMRRGMTRQGATGMLDEGPSATLPVLSPEGSAVNRAGNALEQTFAGGPLAAAKHTAESQLDEGMRTLSETIAGGPGTVPTTRTTAQSAARVQQAVIDDLERKNVQLLQRAFDGVEGQQVIQPARVEALLQRMDDIVANDPLAAKRFDPARTALREIMEASKGTERLVPDPLGVIDPATGAVRMVKVQGPPGVTVSSLRGALSDLGADLGQMRRGTFSGHTSDKAIGQMERAYAELTEEVGAALGKPTPGITLDDVLAGKGTARDAWDMQRAMIAESHNAANPVRQEAMTRMVKQGKLKQSLDFVLKSDPIEQEARLRALRRTADPEDWRNLQSFAISRLGRDAQGNFTPQAMVRQFNKMTPESQAALFDADQLRALKDFALIAERFAKNPLSARGSVNNALYVFNQMAGIPLAGAGAWAGGSAGGAGAAIAGAAAAPAALFGVENVAARWLSNPALTRWLTTTYRAVERNPNAWRAQLGRLLTLKQTNPEFADAIDAYYNAATEGR